MLIRPFLCGVQSRRVISSKFHIPSKTMKHSMTLVPAGEKKRFQRQCMFPKQPNAQSLNLHARRIAQALSRTRESLRTDLQLDQSQNTWRSLVKALPSIQKPHQREFRSLLQKPLSFDIVQQCATFLEAALREMQQHDRPQRIKAWKHKLAQSEKFAYQWIRNKQTAESTAMTLPSGEVTADINKQLDEVFKVWQPIFQKFSQSNADIDGFRQHFIPYMSLSLLWP